MFELLSCKYTSRFFASLIDLQCVVTIEETKELLTLESLDTQTHTNFHALSQGAANSPWQSRTWPDTTCPFVQPTRLGLPISTSVPSKGAMPIARIAMKLQSVRTSYKYITYGIANTLTWRRNTGSAHTLVRLSRDAAPSLASRGLGFRNHHRPLSSRLPFSTSFKRASPTFASNTTGSSSSFPFFRLFFTSTLSECPAESPVPASTGGNEPFAVEASKAVCLTWFCCCNWGAAADEGAPCCLVLWLWDLFSPVLTCSGCGASAEYSSLSYSGSRLRLRSRQTKRIVKILDNICPTEHKTRESRRSKAWSQEE